MWPFEKSVSQRVNDALWQQDLLKGLGLQVSGDGGVVSVSGNVPDQSYIDLITSTAQGISGVTSVDTSGVVYPQAASAPEQQAPDAPTPSVSTPSGSAPSAQPSAPKATPEQVKQAVDASKMAKAVLHAIRSNGELSDDPLDVLQSGNKVIVRGVVDNDHEKNLLQQVASGVSGVGSVDLSGVKVAQGAKDMAKEKDQTSGDTVYTVKPGDSLSAIAEKYYGDAMQYKKIAHYNNISNPDLIHPGDKIKIPG